MAELNTAQRNGYYGGPLPEEEGLVHGGGASAAEWFLSPGATLLEALLRTRMEEGEMDDALATFFNCVRIGHRMAAEHIMVKILASAARDGEARREALAAVQPLVLGHGMASQAARRRGIRGLLRRSPRQPGEGVEE